MAVQGGPECIQASGRRVYGENWRPDNTYDITNAGVPPLSNYPYYVMRYGNCGPGYCSFGYRMGNVNNAPFMWGALSTASGEPRVGYETRWLVGTQREPLTTDYFGLNDAHQINLGYAMRLYNSATGAWTLWGAGTFPSTYCHDDSALKYHSVQTWYAFTVHDDPGAACD